MLSDCYLWGRLSYQKASQATAAGSNLERDHVRVEEAGVQLHAVLTLQRILDSGASFGCFLLLRGIKLASFQVFYSLNLCCTCRTEQYHLSS